MSARKIFLLQISRLKVNPRHGAVRPQKAALSQKPMNATTHSFFGISSLTRRRFNVSSSVSIENLVDSLALIRNVDDGEEMRLPVSDFSCYVLRAFHNKRPILAMKRVAYKAR